MEFYITLNIEQLPAVWKTSSWTVSPCRCRHYDPLKRQ